MTAAYDFDELNELLHAFVVYWNKRVRCRQPFTKGMYDDNVLQTPTRVWKWGAENGCLRAADLANARQQLLPWEKASVTEHGFVLHGLRYLVPDVDPTSPHGIEANEWLAKAREQRWKIDLGIDLSTVSFVWLRHAPRGKAPVMTQCPLAPGQDGFAHLSWEEWRLYKQSQKETLDSYKKGELRGAEENFAAVAKRLGEEALAKTSDARHGMSKSDQTAGISDNRSQEQAVTKTDALPAGGTAGERNNPLAYFDRSAWPEDDKANETKTA